MVYLVNYSDVLYSEEKEDEESKNCTMEIDDEGYRIQPSGQWNVESEVKENFYSSSDSGCYLLIKIKNFIFTVNFKCFCR